MASYKQIHRNKWLHIRLTEPEFNTVMAAMKRTTDRKMSSYARKLILGKPVRILVRDLSLDQFVSELSLLKKELSAIGLEGQPYLVYRHLDAVHEHIHIVTTNIQADGKVIHLHNIRRDRSEKARKETEKIFGLVPAEKDRSQKRKEALKPVSEKIVYGKSETKAAVSNTLRAIVRDYTFTSLAEFNAELRGFNVEAYRGKEESKMFKKSGLTYHVWDKMVTTLAFPSNQVAFILSPH